MKGKRIKNKIIAVLLAGVLISSLPLANGNNNFYTIKADDTYYEYDNFYNENDSDYINENKPKIGINVSYRTEDEIREFAKNHPTDFNAPAEYMEMPLNEPPYSLGKLKYGTLQSALNALNQIRFIAGLSSDVILNDEYVRLAQGASVVNSVNNILTHFPSKPAGMSEELYKIGADGASRSNIGVGYDNIPTSIVFGYMEDGDSSNIDKIGHRRWILNPAMAAAGFGYWNNYTATYVFDKGKAETSEYGVIWPAQNMPTEYFGIEFPWSISMGYYIADASNIQVELTRLSDNKTWKFSQSVSDGYFNVDNGGYGQSGCIIFRPDGIERYINGEKFNVTITGLGEPLSYQVSFFDLVPITDINLEKIPDKLVLGEDTRLNFKVYPENAVNNLKISADSDMLKLSNVYTKDMTSKFKYNDEPEIEYNEEITAIKYGIAKITASTLDDRIVKTYDIKIVPEKGYIRGSSIKSSKNKKYGTAEIYIGRDKTASGYEVLYATNKKFKNAKKLVSNSAKKTKLVIKKVLLSKKYYVKVRSFYKLGNKKIYGDYSKTEKISF